MFHIGGSISRSSAAFAEQQANLLLAAQLVNNKTDGWLDDTPQVVFRVLVSDAGCNKDVAKNATLQQMKWADQSGGELDAVVGSDCDDASLGVVEVSSAALFLQVSHASSGDYFSAKKTSPYFARTVAKDADEVKNYRLQYLKKLNCLIKRCLESHTGADTRAVVHRAVCGDRLLGLLHDLRAAV